MRRWRIRSFHDWSILTKMMSTYVLLIIGVIFVLSWTAYSISADYVEARIGKDVATFTEQMNRSFDQYMDQLDRSVAIIMFTSELNSKFGEVEDANGTNQLESNIAIKRQLNTAVSLSTDIYNISIFTDRGNTFTFLPDNISKAQISKWNTALIQSNQNRIILPMRKSYAYNATGSPVISIFRTYEDLLTNAQVGQMMIDLKPNFLDSLTVAGRLGKSSTLWVVNQSGQFVYPSEFMDSSSEELEQMLNKIHQVPDLTASSQPYLILPTKEGARIFSYSYSARTGLYAIGSVLSAEMYAPLKRIKFNIMKIALVCSLLATAIGYFIAQKLTYSIRQLKAKMAFIKNGNLFVDFDGPFNQDEIGQLNFGFHKMVNRIQQLIEEVYETRLREQEAELQALHSQINPHFLYNTLEAISVVARVEKAVTVPKLCQQLSAILRYSLQDPSQPVTLKEELMQIQHYLHLMETRYAGNLSVEFKLDPLAEQIPVPRLSLQPLVENIFRHAFANRYPPYQIRVQTTLDPLLNMGSIQISDNGCGMTASEVSGIMEVMQRKGIANPGFNRQKSAQIGLMNVSSRFKLLYGEQFQIKVESAVDAGTSFTILLHTEFSHKQEG